MRTKQQILFDLDQEGLKFQEMTSRMNYGHIGNIIKGEDRLERSMVQIFEDCFYVSDQNFALNETTLELIKDIQVVFRELKFEKLKPIIKTLN
jgi:hypothetical protein